MLPLVAILVLLVFCAVVRLVPSLHHFAQAEGAEEERRIVRVQRRVLRKLHTIDATDVVNVGVAVDIIGRVLVSQVALAAVVTGVGYLLIAALFAEA